MSLQKNQIVPLLISAVSAEGSGIGRYQETDGGPGMAVFVPYAAVGDRIDCRILKVEKSLAYGKIEALTEPSSDRIAEPDGCAVFEKCGGCVYRHVTYEAELRYKWQRAADALARIGKLDVVPEPIVGCGCPDRYRNKAQYPAAQGEHRIFIGLYAARSHRIVETRDCLLQPAEFGDILNAVAGWAKKADVSGYNETARTGLLRHIYIRKAEATGEVMVCLVCASGKLPKTDLLLEKLKAIPGLASVAVNINKEATNVILGRGGYTLWGKDFITDELCGLKIRLSPLSFYQVNRSQAERLYRLAAEAAAVGPEDTLLDLYCGAGTIGLSMAKNCLQLIGVESVPDAVADAQKNAAENGIANARFLCADAGEAAAQLSREGVRPAAVILDPPRKGCSKETVEAAAALAPQRIIYVSCDPATLARDLALFEEKGYKTVKVTPVDMFPRTAHVECVALLNNGGIV